MRIFAGRRLYLESAAGSERKSFTTFEACGACIKFSVVSDDGSDPACDDAYIPEPIHPRYRPSRVESSFYLQAARLRIALVVGAVPR
jgi:hypothetical protein